MGMLPPVVIHTTPLSYRIAVTETGFLKGTPVSMTDYCKPFIEYAYNHLLGRWVVERKYRYYNAKTEQLHLPAYDLPRFLNHLQIQNIDWRLVALPLVDGTPVAIGLRPGVAPRDDLQARSIDYLINDGSPVRGLALQTGKGKTASLLMALAGLQKRAIIVLPGLMEQWQRAVAQFTTLDPKEDVYIIQGQNSIFKLFSKIDKTLHPKLILASIGTLRNYALDKESFVNCPPFDDLCRRLQIGVRVIDEAHLNFHANLMMDLRLAPKVTIIMTATFDNSRSEIKAIFDKHYPQAMRFGETEYHRYVDIYAYSFYTGVGDIPSHAYRGQNGYSQARWENWLLRRGKMKLRQIVNDVYLPLLRSHFSLIAEPGEKCLVICETVAMCEYFLKEVREGFPEYRSDLYVYETDDSVLDTADIIISTPKSAGTGRDIKNLLTVLVTTSVRSSTLNKQELGRLRVLPSGRTPQFVYAYNTSIPSHTSHAYERAAIFQPLAKNFYAISLSG